MKTFLALLFIVPVCLYGQNITVQTLETQNVYVNIKNPILCSVCAATGKYLFEASNGIIEFINETMFVTPTNKYEPTIITVFKKNPKKAFKKFRFSTELAGQPTLHLGRIIQSAHQSVPGIDWRRETRLKLSPPNTVAHLKIDTCFGIQSFKVTLVAADGSFDETFYSNSDTIPKAISDRIKSLSSKGGDDIYTLKVHEIKAYANWLSDPIFYLADYITQWYYSSIHD